MRSLRNLLPALMILFLPCTLSAAPGDTDNDGLRDEVETNTGVFVSAENTGTNPNLADTDGDSLPDGMELNLGTNPNDPASKVNRPNIIYILADDLGIGDVSCFWQNQNPQTSKWKIATPNLDAMAAQGAMMTHHYVGAPICASSRSSFLLGQHQGHAAIRNVQMDYPLPDNHNIASVLKASGYHTVHVGKAGLAGILSNPGQSSLMLPAHPLKRGFDRFFGYLRHGDGHEHYPRNGTASRVAFIHDDYTPVTDAYVDLFTSDAWTGFAKKTIIEETQQHPERPFFLYLSYDTPHFYGATSPSATYPPNKGLTGGIQWTGAPSYVNTATNNAANVDNTANKDPSAGSAGWYPAAQRYVSMIKRMDDSVADILQTLRDLGIDDNTLVVFTSDNGPADTDIVPVDFQSYGNFEGIKSDLWEGGIRVPTIAWWPGTISASNSLNNIRKITHPCVNYDWLATFAELAKTRAPSVSDGASLVPTLTSQGIQSDRGFLYFEFLYGGFTSPYPDFPTHARETKMQMQAIRIGDFKGVRYNILASGDPFRIYNVVNDPKESIDLAPSRPDLAARMMHLSISARRKGGGTSRPYDDAPIPPVSPTAAQNGLMCKSYEGHWPWLPDFRDMTPVADVPCTTVSPEPRSRNDDVGLAFTGYLSVPATGAYSFTLNSDASSCLWIHDSRVIDNDYSHVSSKVSDPVYLQAGLHPIRLHYRHQSGSPTLSLSYTGPGIPKQVIPSSSWFVDGPPPVILPDEVTTRRNTSVLSNVLANDTSTLPLSLVSVGPSVLGTTAIESGQVRFTPASGAIGHTEFPYGATNGYSTSTGQVRATIFFENEIWLPLDEGTGTSVNVRGVTPPVSGSLTGAADPFQSWTNGKLGKAIKFDGMDDQVVFPALPLPTASSPRTFSCWIKTTNTSLAENQTIFTYGPASGGQRFTVRLAAGPSAGSLVAAVEASVGTAVGTKALNDGRWHHLALVNDVTDIAQTKIYVDGLSDAVSSSTSEILNTTLGTSACLGGSDQSAACNFNGDIDDVRIFPRALSGTEIQSLRQDTLTSALLSGTALEDFDGDRIPDQAEDIAGTDPDDPQSFFKIHTHTINGSGITLQWSGVAGRTYRMEESSNLKDWTLVPGVAPVVVTVNTPNASMTAPVNGMQNRFVRLQVMRSP